MKLSELIGEMIVQVEIMYNYPDLALNLPGVGRVNNACKEGKQIDYLELLFDLLAFINTSENLISLETIKDLKEFKKKAILLEVD